MWPSNPDRGKGVVNALTVIALLLGILVLLLLIGRSANGTYNASVHPGYGTEWSGDCVHAGCVAH